MSYCVPFLLNLRSKDGEQSVDQNSTLRMTKAIEVGHIFKLGTRYAEALGAKYLDVNGKENVIIMGSYGIGIERIAAAYIEQNHDKDGIVWSGEISPFQIHLISVNKKADPVKESAQKLYDELAERGYEVLFDDRDDISPGVKFKDADLIGIPLQLVVSDKNMKNDEIEVKFRKTGDRLKIKQSEILGSLPELMAKL